MASTPRSACPTPSSTPHRLEVNICMCECECWHKEFRKETKDRTISLDARELKLSGGEKKASCGEMGLFCFCLRENISQQTNTLHVFNCNVCLTLSEGSRDLGFLKRVQGVHVGGAEPGQGGVCSNTYL